MYYVYVIKNEKEEIYIGYSSNLKKRMTGHNTGNTKTTRGHQWELIYYEAYRAESDARRRERALKKSGAGRKWLKTRIQDSLQE